MSYKSTIGKPSSYAQDANKGKVFNVVTATVFILNESVGKGVARALKEDLEKFQIRNVKICDDQHELIKMLKASPAEAVIICSAELAHAGFTSLLEYENLPTLRATLLFCGPHEEQFARWGAGCPSVTFLSHNLKEIRRAVSWIMSGGSFAPNGDAVAPTHVKPTLQKQSQQVEEDPWIELARQLENGDLSFNMAVIKALKKLDFTKSPECIPGLADTHSVHEHPSSMTSQVFEGTPYPCWNDFKNLQEEPAEAPAAENLLKSDGSRHCASRSSTDSTSCESTSGQSISSNCDQVNNSNEITNFNEDESLAEIANLISLFQALRASF